MSFLRYGTNGTFVEVERFDYKYKKYCYIYYQSTRKSASRGGGTFIDYACLDIKGFLNFDYGYKENDEVIWWDFCRTWNQTWILEVTGDYYYIKDCNNNLYLCYGDNGTMFLSKESQNKIMLM